MSAELNDDAKLGASKERERATPSSTGTGAEVVDTVRGIMEDAKSGALNTAENSKDAVAARLDDVAKAVHRSGEQLEGHHDWMAQWVERGADQLSGLASTLRTNDLKGLFGEIEELARGQPALFVGAAMAAGFATARLSKVAVAGASRADLPEMPEVLRERESD